MNIDRTTYDKHAAYAVGHGYEARVASPISIVVHSTSSAVKNTVFENEANFLYRAAKVSAHFLIGRNGRVVEFLDPFLWAAWHAGPAQPRYLNQHSVGIELHHSVGDAPYPAAQLAALAALLRQLMRRFRIPVAFIETHGQIAIKGPYIRKKDPDGWNHVDFIEWRDRLDNTTYRVAGLPVYQRSDHSGALWGHLQAGELVVIDDATNGHLADGRGFVDLSGLDAL